MNFKREGRIVVIYNEENGRTLLHALNALVYYYRNKKMYSEGGLIVCSIVDDVTSDFIKSITKDEKVELIESIGRPNEDDLSKIGERLNVFYIDRGGDRLRTSSTLYALDGYKTKDGTLLDYDSDIIKNIINQPISFQEYKVVAKVVVDEYLDRIRDNTLGIEKSESLLDEMFELFKDPTDINNFISKYLCLKAKALISSCSVIDGNNEECEGLLITELKTNYAEVLKDKEFELDLEFKENGNIIVKGVVYK